MQPSFGNQYFSGLNWIGMVGTNINFRGVILYIMAHDESSFGQISLEELYDLGNKFIIKLASLSAVCTRFMRCTKSWNMT